jgi:bacillithiol biosynthesis deacetylase BshB1
MDPRIWDGPDARPLDVLAVAAHRDDVEQTCGGALLKMAQTGAACGVLDLTRGEAGTRGNAAQRGREAERAGEILRLAWRANLALPDGQITNSLAARHRIAAVIRATRPQLLIVPYPAARHPDHAITGRLGMEAAFAAGLKNLEVGGGAAFRPHTVLYASLYANRRPTIVVDISEQFAARLRALEAYGSQYADQAKGAGIFPAAADVPARVEALARTYGMMVGVRYGEPYICATPIRAGDLRQLEIDTFTQGGIIAPF